MQESDTLTIQQSSKPSWNGLMALYVGVIAYIVAQLSMALLFVVISAVDFLTNGQKITLDDNLLQQNWFNLLVLAVSDICLLLVVVVFLRSKKASIKQLGIKKPKISQFSYVPVVAFVYFMMLILALSIAPYIITGLNLDQQQDIGFTKTENWQILLAFVGLVVITPFTEEVFFRGFIYQGLKNKTNKNVLLGFGVLLTVFAALVFDIEAPIIIAILTLLAAILIDSKPKLAAAIFTSMLFALAHAQWNVAIDTFILSFALIWLLEKTGNIWASVALHALKNLIAFLAIFVFNA